MKNIILKILGAAAICAGIFVLVNKILDLITEKQYGDLLSDDDLDQPRFLGFFGTKKDGEKILTIFVLS